MNPKLLLLFLSLALPARAATSFGPGVHDGKGTQVLTGVLLIQDGATLIHYKWNGATADLSGHNNITITACDIGNVRGNAILVHGGHGLNVTACTFHDITGTGIYTNGNAALSNSHFDRNTFDRVYEPIHLEWAIGAGNCTVSHNVINHATRHAIELQGTPRGLTVDGNWIDNWLAHPDPKNLNDSHMGISCATGVNGTTFGTNVRVVNNYIGANGIPDGWNTPNGGWWDFAAIEAFGDGTIVDNNWIGPWGIGVMAGDNGPAGWQFTNNVLVGTHSPQTTENRGVNPAIDKGNQTFAAPTDPGCPPAPANPAAQPADPAPPATAPVVPSDSPDPPPQTQPASARVKVHEVDVFSDGSIEVH